MAARDFGQRAAARQQRDADPHLHRALDPVEARQRDLDVDRRPPALVGAQHAIARRRRIVVRDHHLPADFLERDAPLRRPADASAPSSRTMSSPPRGTVWTPRSAGWNVRTPKSMLRSSTAPAIWRDGTRRTSTATCGCSAGEALDVRQQAVDGRLVGADDDPAARGPAAAPGWPSAASPASPSRRCGVVLEQAAGLGQGAVPRGAVEQPLAQLILDAPDRLADGRLGPVEPPGGRGEAPVRRNRQESGQIRQLHKSTNTKPNNYKLD